MLEISSGKVYLIFGKYRFSGCFFKTFSNMIKLERKNISGQSHVSTWFHFHIINDLIPQLWRGF